ncbi:hypothetical protein COCSADRAFT_33973, partial [Bipolaris sorokiniana ND90Pr]
MQRNSLVEIAILATLTPSSPTQPYSPTFVHDSATGVRRKNKVRGNTAHSCTIPYPVLHVHIARHRKQHSPKENLI